MNKAELGCITPSYSCQRELLRDMDNATTLRAVYPWCISLITWSCRVGCGRLRKINAVPSYSRPQKLQATSPPMTRAVCFAKTSSLSKSSRAFLFPRCELIPRVTPPTEKETKNPWLGKKMSIENAIIQQQRGRMSRIFPLWNSSRWMLLNMGFSGTCSSFRNSFISRLSNRTTTQEYKSRVYHR